LSPKQYKAHLLLSNDLNFYIQNGPIKIIDKETNVKTLALNRAQLYVHNEVQRMKEETGYVRMLSIKGRQQGISTYVSARYFQKTTRNTGVTTFIMAHNTDTTTLLFRKAEFYLNNIRPELRPHVERSNRKELYFDKLMSSYFVGTAGSGEVGRGGTVQNFHGSEVAFWTKPDQVKNGVMQSVPDSKNTEIFLESTGNGYDPMFYPMVQDARQKKGLYRVVFVPWFWQQEYQADASNIIITPEESELMKAFKLTLEQIAWRRNKIAFWNGSVEKFMQEYPSTIDEAFQVSGQTLFGGLLIPKAQARKFDDFDSPKIMGVDVATEKDRLTYFVRQGRSVKYIKVHNCAEKGSKTTTQIAGEVLHLAKELGVGTVFIDLGEAGKGVFDQLNDLHLSFKLIGVRFGESASDDRKYVNKRAEMYDAGYEWLKDASLPQDTDNVDEFIADLRIIPDFEYDVHDRKKLPKKTEIKAKYGFSPDISDAFVLTFAHPVINTRIEGSQQFKVKVKRKGFLLK
jgi:hypothetical protein